MDTIVLQSEGISKRFGGVQALDSIQFDLNKGEVHALVGENGAGKSTYIKILCGIYRKDAGKTIYNGEEIDFRNNMEARLNGIGMVPQLIELAPKLTVGENIFMGVYPKTTYGFINWKELYKKAFRIAQTFHIEHLIHERVERLGTGQKQLIEILKALIFDTKVIAFDEPTASLSDEESKELFTLIELLRCRDISIIYVSHRLEEIFQIADRVTVLKDGHYVGTRQIKEVTKEEVVSMMVGRDLDLYGTDQRQVGEREAIVFEAKNLKNQQNVNDVSFTLHKGEILGFFGMVGSGRTETAMAIFGENPLEEGEMYLNGEHVSINSPSQAVNMGIGLVPEDRISQGVILGAPIRNNITLPFVNRLARNGFIHMKKERSVVQEYMGELGVKAPNEDVKVNTLSGGNQQKVSIAKWLATKSDVIIFDEPTHGIDVGAKHDIYMLLRELSDEGKGIIMISSELPEILNVCDRILVFRDGTIVHEFQKNQELQEEDVVKYALG